MYIIVSYGEGTATLHVIRLFGFGGGADGADGLACAYFALPRAGTNNALRQYLCLGGRTEWDGICLGRTHTYICTFVRYK